MPNDHTPVFPAGEVSKTSALSAFPFCVYRILDPRTGLPFYIGQTENLPARKEQHKTGRVHSTAARIHQIQAAGLQPAFEQLGTARCRDNAVMRELMELVRHVRAGYEMTNPSGEISRAQQLIRVVLETDLAFAQRAAIAAPSRQPQS